MQPRHLVPALIAAFAVACSDSNGPTPPHTTSVRLNICPYGLVWAAYKNEGAAWTRVDVGSDGAITFDATDKVSFAYVLAGGSVAYTQVYNTTVAELLAVNDMPCSYVYGIGTVTGSVAGVTGTQVAKVAGGYSLTSSSASATSWVLRDLPTSSAVDVLALRFPTSASSTPDALILRRGVMAAGTGTAIGTVDFTAAEAVAPEGATATFSNVGTDALYVATDLYTANITQADLASQYVYAAPYAATYLSLPGSVRIGTDRHVLYAYALSGSTLRAILRYYVAPAARTFTFGPVLAASTVTTVATSPYLRLKASVASQAEYASGARVIFYQQPTPTSLREIIITTSAGFLGGIPVTWEVEVPDFVAAYQSSWGLVNAQYSAQVAAFQGELRYEGRPADGTTVLMALRSTSASPLVASRSLALTKRMLMP